MYIASRRNIMTEEISQQPGRLLTIAQFAGRLNIPLRTLQWQIAHGYIKGAFKVGEGRRGVWVVPESAIMGYRRPTRGPRARPRRATQR